MHDAMSFVDVCHDYHVLALMANVSDLTLICVLKNEHDQYHTTKPEFCGQDKARNIKRKKHEPKSINLENSECILSHTSTKRYN